MDLYKNSFNNNVYFVSCQGDVHNIIEKCWPYDYLLDYHIIDISNYRHKCFALCINRNVYPQLKNNLPFHISPYVTMDVAGEMQNPYEWIVSIDDKKEVIKQLRIIRNLNIIRSSIEVCEYKKCYTITFSEEEEYEGSIAIAKSIISRKTKIVIQWSNIDEYLKIRKVKKNISNFCDLTEQDVDSS